MLVIVIMFYRWQTYRIKLKNRSWSKKQMEFNLLIKIYNYTLILALTLVQITQNWLRRNVYTYVFLFYEFACVRMCVCVYMNLLLMKQINVYQNGTEFEIYIYIWYDKVSKYIDERIKWRKIYGLDFFLWIKKGQTQEDIQYWNSV